MRRSMKMRSRGLVLSCEDGECTTAGENEPVEALCTREVMVSVAREAWHQYDTLILTPAH